jgi:hypothetical protein
MKTLLRHTSTGLYFQGLGKWTNDPDEAVNFRFIDRALAYIQTWQLKEVELAFAFEGDPSAIDGLSVQAAAEQCTTDRSSCSAT